MRKRTIGYIGVVAVVIIIIYTWYGSNQNTGVVQEQKVSEITLQNTNAVALNLVTTCIEATSASDLEACKQSVLQIKTKCADPLYSSMPICNNPRIDQIINKSQGLIPETQTEKANQEVSKFVYYCSKATNQTDITTCAADANKILGMCKSNHIPECDDPYIQEIANRFH